MKNGKRTALVTGAARGIGRGISLTLAERGYTVCAVGTKPGEAVAEYTDALKALSPESFYVRGDISSHDDRLRIADEAFDGLDELDVLVNNAGVAPSVRADLLDMTEESFDRVLGINLRGAFFLTQEVARRMASQKNEAFRAVVFITSISAEVSSVKRGEYCISKAGLSMAATLYADRLAEYGIRVYEVRPGIIATDMTAGVREKYDRLIAEGLCPIPRIGQPEDVGRTVLALADGALSYTTGQVVGVDGGMMIRKL
ncbi:MAG: 3-ketoacyl-ACP reductase [Ruminococcaceae bacterium]|jgi:NAD(P)-dependent dehydrogenase (short-subunit alcohol dehydrogenase family)|nr:3-ketoacyl-ACP reductase [Oscillospiraceae bacterium]